ncbi:hypothetical protein ANN_03186 [Periplaneta americana]|uniref:SGNH hydrolase-type esterase domain-containing protein n=1 Tax=Periplaneta americana TaxID=6978 RepID=A0ABQ8TZZ3_PERAM|nr:hypothetical protein ANN_03186 [Periplaneta americana]
MHLKQRSILSGKVIRLFHLSNERTCKRQRCYQYQMWKLQKESTSRRAVQPVREVVPSDLSEDQEEQIELIGLRNEVKKLREKLETAEQRIKFLEDENKLLRREKENGEEREEKKKHGAASVIIIGDSIIRHVGNLQPELATECYPGIRVKEMKSVIENQERGDPKNIVLHVGTNDLRRGVDYIMADVYDLVMETKKKYPAAGIVISGIVRRRDVNWRKVGRVNKAFEWVAECLGARFVDPNSWIEDRCFGRDGIHLNRRGAADMGSLFARVVTTTWRGGIEDPTAGSGTEGPSVGGGGVGLPAVSGGESLPAGGGVEGLPAGGAVEDLFAGGVDLQ